MTEHEIEFEKFKEYVKVHREELIASAEQDMGRLLPDGFFEWWIGQIENERDRFLAMMKRHEEWKEKIKAKSKWKGKAWAKTQP